MFNLMDQTVLVNHPIFAALIAGLFAWGMTALGAGGVFVFRTVTQKLLDAMLGFAAGVMIAASFWSLLAPSIVLSGQLGVIKWVPPAIGFLTGGAFLWIVDKILPHLNIVKSRSRPEGLPTGWHTTVLLFLAITFHNFPEGLAVGVAFGAAAAGIPGATIASAIALAIGIGIQNFPEGFAVSMPFRRVGVGKLKSFLFGQGSAIVEPIAAVIGVVGILAMRPLLPYALAFAAGAMIYVSVEEIIPESQKNSTDVATIGAMLGFTIMMILDVALG
ncbi:MAG: Zinc transporter [Candidatus Woesebacteria bacterium GW2011_GWB1_39_12]|uniref:Zinc transporter n=1 Tax=Candidatus Woesebacteria bacterium GW2011_GWB1_39_12 TaxID=1618574 RepID=A0A0G0M9H9_9BACT|nr:MAG: Zinc transporter [Candidatus Woesebacteria bacterium GW2011_GWB1_39_12]